MDELVDLGGETGRATIIVVENRNPLGFRVLNGLNPQFIAAVVSLVEVYSGAGRQKLATDLAVLGRSAEAGNGNIHKPLMWAKAFDASLKLVDAGPVGDTGSEFHFWRSFRFATSS